MKLQAHHMQHSAVGGPTRALFCKKYCSSGSMTDRRTKRFKVYAAASLLCGVCLYMSLPIDQTPSPPLYRFPTPLPTASGRSPTPLPTLKKATAIADRKVVPIDKQWRHCMCRKLKTNAEKDDWLMKMLVNTAQVLTKHGVFYTLAYGTLLGAVRGNDINPNEVDNDIVVNARLFAITPELEKSFFDLNMIIFRHDIYRVCEFDPHSTKSPHFVPWQHERDEVCAYSDLYPTTLDQGLMIDRVTKQRVAISDPLVLETILVRDTPFPVFPRNVSLQLIVGKYGEDWMLPPSNVGKLITGHEPWKQKLLRGLDRSARSKAFADIECPPVVTDKQFQHMQEHVSSYGNDLRKYKYKHADKNSEACKRGTWNLIGNDQHRSIARTVIRHLGLKRGDEVFDWGCGCGDMLGWMYDWEAIRGFGVDIVQEGITRAQQAYDRPGLKFCAGDAQQMVNVPSNRFHHAVAWGTIYHLGSRKLICDAVRGLVRIVRPGGKVLISYNHRRLFEATDKEYEDCLGDIAAWVFTPDVKMYPEMAPYARGNTYTVELTKA